ncbi:MAG: FeoC-like transcriptional regulator [Anaerolineae bacterium]
MLEQLLTEIRRGGTLETNTLAPRLGTTPQMVAVMLEHLQRSGVIKDYINCSDGCSGCNLKEQCSAKRPVRLWQTS